MQEKDEIQVLIDKYLRGTLTPQEQVAWQQALERPEVQEELKLQEDVLSALKPLGREKLKAQFSQWDQEAEKTAQPEKVRPLWRTYAALAVAAAAVILVFIFWPSSSPAFEERLFAEHFIPYENVVEVQVRGSEQSATQRSLAFKFYDMGDYAAASRSLLAIPDLGSNPEILFYLANSHLAEGEIDQALEEFRLVRSMGKDFAEHAAWYEALCLWPKGQKEASISIWEEITATSGHVFAKQSQTILKKLKESEANAK
ncbi:MAG: hypothetical protein AAFR61_12610 [Bacteroidota bacterium]